MKRTFNGQIYDTEQAIAVMRYAYANASGHIVDATLYQGAGLVLFIVHHDPDDQPMLEPVTGAEIGAIVSSKSGRIRDVTIMQDAILAQLLEDAIAQQGGLA